MLPSILLGALLGLCLSIYLGVEVGKDKGTTAGTLTTAGISTVVCLVAGVAAFSVVGP